MGSRAPRLTLDVQFAVKSASLPSKQQLRIWSQAALERDAQVTLRLVDEAEGLRLNRTYRGRDYATNVLTFTYEGQVLPWSGPLSGDIVLCAPVIEAEAREQGKTPEAHYAHLVVHGMLHLQGYDHERDDEAAVMETRESEIVVKLGYPDPYHV
ncbi:MAG TPA: rRNA maturation RNase YbeY [Burkholderiales bacterium]|nr:rRNA maturation RNase YbeY [Burkholderiales bacterium]